MDDPPATVQVLIGDDEHISSAAMRQRNVPHAYFHPQEQLPPPPQLAPQGGIRVPPNYTGDKYRRQDNRPWYQKVKSYFAPTEDDRLNWQMDYESARLAANQSYIQRAKSGLCAGFSMLAAFVVVLILWDVAVSKGEVGDMRVIQLLWSRDHVRVIPQLIMPDTGEIVHNVLNPSRAVETVGDVAAVIHKIRNSRAQRVAQVAPGETQRGYAEYTYKSSTDLDADAVLVNFTFSALKKVMKPPWNSQLVCEGAIHYGIERNIVAVYDWGASDKRTDDGEKPYLLYNAQIVEMGCDEEPLSELIKHQKHCRIADVILAETVATENPINNETDAGMVHSSGTLEYMSGDSGLKKRRVIRQPLLACVEHVLKLSGLQK